MPTTEELGLPWEVAGKSIRMVNRRTFYEVDGKTYPITEGAAPNAYGGGVCNCLGGRYGSSKKDPFNQQAVARAQFIVEACNNYHQLLKRVCDLEEDLGIEHNKEND